MNRYNNLRRMLCMCLVSISINAMAQTPGYLGKKNSFQFGVNSIVSINGLMGNCDKLDRSPTVTGVQTDCSQIGLSYGFTGRATRSVSRSTSLFLDAHIYNTDMIGYYYTLVKEYVGQEYYEQYSSNTLENIKAKEFCVGAQFFSLKRGSIAPMGVYFGLGAGLGFYNTTLKDTVYQLGYFQDREFIEFRTPITRENRMYPLLKLEVGTSTIIKDKFLLNLNVSSTLPLAAEVFVPSDLNNPYNLYDESVQYSNYENSYDYKNALGNRILTRGAILLGLNIGIIY